MEIKVLFEIEEGSKKVIENFSKALTGLSSTAPVQNIAASVAGKIKEPEKVETEIKTGDWQTNDVKVEPEKKEETPVKNVETPKETPKEEEPKKAEAPVEETQGWSYDQLKAGCHEASTMNLGSKVAELIKGKYKLSKLTELDPKLYDAFANDLRELGVRI